MVPQVHEPPSRAVTEAIKNPTEVLSSMARAADV